MVFACVTMTLVDVIGTLSFWKTTIDPLSSVNIILAVGLCIDYPAHIAHSFLVATGNHNTIRNFDYKTYLTSISYLEIFLSGSSKERAQTSLLKILPAVLNGGMTTFLALVVLATSNSHAFLTFFKVFFLTVVFGMFHGVVFLPTLLSWVGGEKINKNASQATTDIQMTPPNNGKTQSESSISQSKDNSWKTSKLDMFIIYLTGAKYN